MAATRAIVLWLALASHAVAQQRPGVDVAARGGVYQDDDATTIATSTVAVRARPAGELTVEGRYLVDVTSTASVDVVSAATDRWDEVRHEAAGSVSFFDGTFAGSAGYVYSVENDWESHTVSAGVAHDFLEHNLTVTLGGTFVHNDVGRRDDTRFHERMRVYGGSLGAVIVGSPDDIWRLAYALSLVRGYQASPYRFVRFADPVTPLALSTRETHPDRRVRQALAVQNNHVLSEATVLRSHGRLYVDDWGIASITLGTEVVLGFEPWELGLAARGYAQTGASFYEDVYAQRRQYMTADRELSPFYDVFAGPRLAFHSGPTGVFEDLRFEVEVQGFAFFYPDFSRLERRLGFVAELGLGASL